jgi:2,4-dienoyl-CoA reductase-like NADH-dependent reductase (Old Yellow Enzyme family)
MRIAGVDIGYERAIGLRTPVEQRPMLFRPLTLRGLTIRNRIMLAPMSQYLVADDGVPTDWQIVHLGQFAMGGAGIVFSEETAVEARGRRTHNCTGIYTAEQARGWRRVTDFLKDLGAAPAMQLGHGGSRGSHRSPYQARRPLLVEDTAIGMGPWPVVSSSPIANNPGHPAPTALDLAGIREEIAAWRDAALHARDAGFDIIEIHGAHGYLIQQFLSPLLNTRTDAYGGDLQGRMRFALELTEAVREAWPKDKPLFFRVSAVEGSGGLWDIDDTVALAKELKARGVDVIDCSSGLGDAKGVSDMPPVPRGMPGCHVIYADHVRRTADIPTVAVGVITEPQQAEDVLQQGKADIIGVARVMMRNPYWPVDAAQALGLEDWAELLPPTYVARLKAGWDDQEKWRSKPQVEIPFRRTAK